MTRLMHPLEVELLRPPMERLVRLLVKRPGWGRFIHPGKAEYQIRLALEEGRVYEIHGCAVMIDIGADWYSLADFLFEKFVLAIHEDARPDLVPAALVQLARDRGCVAVVSGDMVAGLMNRHYTAAGFKPDGTNFYTEV